MTAPVLNTHIGGVFTGGTSQTVTLPTITAGDIVCVAVFVELNGTLRTVSSVTASGLTFVKRTSYQFTSDTGTGIELWWALASGGASNTVITVNVNLAPDDWAIHAFSVTGCNTASPWDSNASLPAKQSYTTGGPSLSASTTFANTMMIGLWCSPGGGTDSTGAESTVIEARSTAGGSRFIHSRSEYHAHTTVQTSVATTIGVAAENSGMIVDALTADSAGINIPASSHGVGVTMAVSLQTDNFTTVSGALGVSMVATLTTVRVGKQPVVCVIT